MCFVCSKEPSHRDGSFEYPQHMFWLRNKKNNFLLRTFHCGADDCPFYFSGWLADITSSYNSSFFMVGACFLVSCVLTLVIPLRWNCSHASRSQQYELELPNRAEQTKVEKEK